MFSKEKSILGQNSAPIYSTPGAFVKSEMAESESNNNTSLISITIAKLSPNSSLAGLRWSLMLTWPHPTTHPAGKVLGKQDKAIYAKRKLSVFRSLAQNCFRPQPKQLKQLFKGYNRL